jgi:hypothetical protein
MNLQKMLKKNEKFRLFFQIAWKNPNIKKDFLDQNSTCYAVEVEENVTFFLTLGGSDASH